MDNKMEGYKNYELQKFINVIYEAVDKSNAGPIYQKHEEGRIKIDDSGNPILCNLAYNTFLSLINSLAPKNFTGSWNIDRKFIETQK